MDEVISFLNHAFEAILFCIALSLLFLYGSIEQKAMNALEEKVIYTSVYQR